MKKITFTALTVPLTYVLIMLLCSLKTYAQEKTLTLSGVVKDVNGPLAGVLVWQTDTENGTQTNELGFYTIQIPMNTQVTFDYLGYKPQTFTVKTSTLNVTMVADENMLDEMVINAGYYTVKDKERTGSISKITAKEIGQQPVANPLAAMQGRMAGVNITQNSGVPGGGFDIQIRGRNSLRTEGNAPLYIVDGVPFASQSASDQTLSGQIFSKGNVSPLNSINPNDIESIEVLKDADATAIYGSRGSNGVVLITTKKGSSDRTTFSFQSTTSVSTVAKYMDLMNTDQYLQMRRDAFANAGITDYPANAYDVNGIWDENKYTNWQKEFLGGRAVSQNTQFSVSGGSGKTNYLFSAGHRKDETVFPGDFGYKRTNFLLNVNHQSKDDRFYFQSTVLKSNQKNNLMVTDLTSQIFLAPNAPDLYDAEGNLNWENNTFENPLAKLNATYESQSNDFSANVVLGYALIKNLNVSLNAGLQTTNNVEFKKVPTTTMNPALGFTSKDSSVSRTLFSRDGWIMEPKLNYSLVTNTGVWNFLLGTTFEERKQDILGLRGNGFLSNDMLDNLQSATSQLILKDADLMYRYQAFYARVNYIHQQKYIVNLTGRRDGSSRFGPGKQWGNFGAVGTAWLFSRENVFDKSSWLSFGKLRASYGIAGNDLIGDYQYLNTFRLNYLKYDEQIALEPTRLFNPDFSWETNKKVEVALELELFKSRIAPSIVYYSNRSSNQLVGIPLPGTTGFASVQANLNATVENSGWEFTLRSINMSKNQFFWSTNINISLPKNKLIAFPNLEESTYANTYEIGKPTSIRKVYTYTGIDPVTGLFTFEDLNGDGKIDVNDRKKAMNVNTMMFAGIQNSINYKNWSLDFTIQFVKQNALSPLSNVSPLGYNVNNLSMTSDYVSNENPNGSYQIPILQTNSLGTQAYENYKNSDQMIIDGSYIRLKSLQLQYSWQLNNKSNSRIATYVQGQNLFTITNYPGSDPETAIGYLPALRTIALGFNFNF
ncbi:SusC/RagA family TonB-linked outer membrane protein [Flavobacterium sp. I3-2]|uniref:SusC/RagA family TonB-linked outer membrane protein n=1 Tax=Flavobacterium sp. I3-2 TaxID=2748319 RepID=UPI0015B010A9|nr:SusC/RagA family TonB-linked outer membrane protein [Flavobacterium sp. I3-2]